VHFVGLKYEKVMAVRIPIIAENLLTSWAAVSFSNKTVFVKYVIYRQYTTTSI